MTTALKELDIVIKNPTASDIDKAKKALEISNRISEKVDFYKKRREDENIRNNSSKS